MLRITRLTDYATVALTAMACEQAVVLSASALAERTGLESSTVAKVLKPLAQAGLVQAYRGASGGYRLARAPQEIGLVEILEAMEGPLAMTECSIHDGQCGLEQDCRVRPNWRRINDAVIEALRGVSLADLCRQPAAPADPRTIPVALHVE